MPKVNVYLPDALAESVRRLQIPLSTVCQDALEQEVVKRESVAIGGGHLVDRGAKPLHRCGPPVVDIAVHPWTASGTSVGFGAKWRCGECRLVWILGLKGTWSMDLSPLAGVLVDLFRNR